MRLVYSARARDQIRRLPPQIKGCYARYRILYEYEEPAREIRIARVGPRKDVYQEALENDERL